MFLSNKLYSLIKYMFVIISAVILAIVLFSDFLTFQGMNEFKYKQIVYLILGISIVILAILIIEITKVKKEKKSLNNNINKYIIIFTIFFFFIKIFIGYHTYILASWDISAAIVPASKAIVTHDNTLYDWFSQYYSNYPNNIILCLIYSKIFLALKAFKIFDYYDSLFFIIVLNTLFAYIEVYLVYHCSKKLLGKKWAIFAWVTNLLLVGFSQWSLITYSDPFSVHISIIIFTIYLSEIKNRINLFVNWFILGLLFFWGYHIKPQSIIVFIAIVFVEIIKEVINKKNNKELIIKLCSVIFSLVISNGIFQSLNNQFPFYINEGQELSMPHFIMMGLNKETDGKYLESDVIYSKNFNSQKERTYGNFSKIKERLMEYGAEGYLQLLVKKTAICYSDGTFGYSDGAQNPEEMFVHGNNKISNLIGYYVYPQNEGFKQTENIYQVVWITILFGTFIAGVFIKKNYDYRYAVIMLTIVGIFLFEILFEVQPRHLYCNVSLYVISGSLGIKLICNLILKNSILNKINC